MIGGVKGALGAMNMITATARAGRGVRGGVALLMAALVSLVCVSSVGATFGEDYGAAPINGHPDALQDVPALPGYENAFWAGSCDRGSAPGFNDPLEDVGGVGSRRSTVLAGAGGTTEPQLSPPVRWRIVA